LRLEGLDNFENKSNDIGNRNRDLPACRTVLQPTTLQSSLFH
jgi:hypothetical protein